MLCYRCGSHAPDASEACPNCGQRLNAPAAGRAPPPAVGRRTGARALEGAPYKPGDVVAGRYRIQEGVGSGPLGTVFRARDQQLDVEVALKSIHPHLVQTPEERTHFGQVMRLGRKVSHANLLRVYEEGEDGGRLFFTTQFVDGMSLRRIIDLRLSKGQLFSPQEAEPLLAQMVGALEAAHRVGPHGDFRPDNVLVLPDLLKVTDVGLGMAVPARPFLQALRQLQSDRYLAPEVGEGEVDVRADVYALAVVLGEMLAGLVPEDGGPPELGRRAPHLPSGLEGLYRKALSANPLARQRSVTELLSDVTEAVRRHASRPPAPAQPASRSTLPQDTAPTVAMQVPPGLLALVAGEEGAPTVALTVPGGRTLPALPLVESLPLPPAPERSAAAPVPRPPPSPAPGRLTPPPPGRLTPPPPGRLTSPPPGQMNGVSSLHEKPPPPVPDLPDDASIAATELVVPRQGTLPALPVAEVMRPAAPPGRRERTEVLSPPVQAAATPALFALARQGGKVPPTLWLGLLAVVGLAVGAGAGLWLLERLRPPATPTVVPLRPAPRTAAEGAP